MSSQLVMFIAAGKPISAIETRYDVYARTWENIALLPPPGETTLPPPVTGRLPVASDIVLALDNAELRIRRAEAAGLGTRPSGGGASSLAFVDSVPARGWSGGTDLGCAWVPCCEVWVTNPPSQDCIDDHIVLCTYQVCVQGPGGLVCVPFVNSLCLETWCPPVQECLQWGQCWECT